MMMMLLGENVLGKVDHQGVMLQGNRTIGIILGNAAE